MLTWAVKGGFFFQNIYMWTISCALSMHEQMGKEDEAHILGPKYESNREGNYCCDYRNKSLSEAKRIEANTHRWL
jgi:hypothetical protein